MVRSVAADVVDIWEAGSACADAGRAMAVLAPLFPDVDPHELATVSVGERNARLLSVRAALIGPAMRAVVTCPTCSEPLEFEQRIDELLEGYVPPADRHFAIDEGDHAADCRLVTARDLMDIAGCGEEDEARHLLIARTVERATCRGLSIAPHDLPEAVVRQIAETVAASDPLSIVAIPLACAACAHIWSATLEIVSFLWAEIDRQARLVLADVVQIARAFGWSETEIRAMSSARRHYYLAAIEPR